jgi:hypothetical protein
MGRTPARSPRGLAQALAAVVATGHAPDPLALPPPGADDTRAGGNDRTAPAGARRLARRPICLRDRSRALTRGGDRCLTRRPAPPNRNAPLLLQPADGLGRGGGTGEFIAPGDFRVAWAGPSSPRAFGQPAKKVVEQLGGQNLFHARLPARSRTGGLDSSLSDVEFCIERSLFVLIAENLYACYVYLSNANFAYAYHAGRLHG